MRVFEAVRFALTSPDTRAKTLLWFVGIALLLAIPTALLSNPVIAYVRMIPATPLDYAFLFATSLLSAVYLAIPKTACAANGKAVGGGFAGFFAVSCPVCNKLIVLLLGFDFAYGVLEPARPILGVVSVALLVYAIGRKWGAGNGKKPRKKREANKKI